MNIIDQALINDFPIKILVPAVKSLILLNYAFFFAENHGYEEYEEFFCFYYYNSLF